MEIELNLDSASSLNPVAFECDWLHRVIPLRKGDSPYVPYISQPVPVWCACKGKAQCPRYFWGKWLSFAGDPSQQEDAAAVNA